MKYALKGHGLHLEIDPLTFLRSIFMPRVIARPVVVAPAPQAARPEVSTAAAAPAPVEVNVATNATTGQRTVTISLPAFQQFTDEQKRAMESDAKPPQAYCDLTGVAIRNRKNVNEIRNDDRPEFNGKIISTTVLKQILEALCPDFEMSAD